MVVVALLQNKVYQSIFSTNAKFVFKLHINLAAFSDHFRGSEVAYLHLFFVTPVIVLHKMIQSCRNDPDKLKKLQILMIFAG